MSVTITESGRALSTAEVEEFERVISWKLPVAYSDFLLRHNGGRPEPDVIDIETLEGSPTDVQQFFGIQQPYESSELKWNYDLLAGRPGERLLPVACDSSGNLFALTPDGGVSYLEVSWEGGRHYRVAAGFEEFLNMIRPFED